MGTAALRRAVALQCICCLLPPCLPTGAAGIVRAFTGAWREGAEGEGAMLLLGEGGAYISRGIPAGAGVQTGWYEYTADGSLNLQPEGADELPLFVEWEEDEALLYDLNSGGITLLRRVPNPLAGASLRAA